MRTVGTARAAGAQPRPPKAAQPRREAAQPRAVRRATSTATDAVYIPASRYVRIPLVADVFSLTISNAALLAVNGPSTRPTSISGITAGNTTTTNATGLRVRGDLSMLGSAWLVLGGKNQQSHPYVAVGGDFLMPGPATTGNSYAAFSIHAGPADADHDFNTGGATVTVGGRMAMGSLSVFYPWGHVTTGTTLGSLSTGLGVVLNVRELDVAEGSLITGYGKGFPRYAMMPNNLTDLGTTRYGGSHGGLGGRVSASGSRKAVYDRPYAPVMPGMGGGNATVTGGLGGSALRVVAETVRLNGTLVHDGNNGTSTGGAAGGSVFILCDDLELGPNAYLSAAGRHGGERNTPTGGGAGGRIAIALGLTPAERNALVTDGEVAGVTPHEATVLLPEGRLSVKGGIGNQWDASWDDGEDGTAFFLTGSGVTPVTVATLPASRAAVSPSSGLHAYAPGTTVSATAPEYAATDLDAADRGLATTSVSLPSTPDYTGRRPCAGWTLTDGDGTVVASGDGTNATFTVGSAPLTLTWSYETRKYRLDATATEGGSVSYAQAWADASGTFPALAATPADATYAFAYWAGDVDATNRFDNPLAAPANRERRVVAVFCSATPKTYTWNKFKDGTAYSWTDPASWTPRGIPGPNDTAVIVRNSGTQANALIESYACVSKLTVRGPKAYLRIGSTTSSFGDHTMSSHSPLDVTAPFGLDVRGDLAVTNCSFLMAGAELLPYPVSVRVGGNLVVGGGASEARFGIYGADTAAATNAPFEATGLLSVAGTATVQANGSIFADCHARTGGYPLLSFGRLVVEEGGNIDGYTMGCKNYVRAGAEYSYPWPTHQQNTEAVYFGGSHGGLGGAASKASGAMQYVGEAYGYTNTPVHSGMQGGNSGGRPGAVIRIDAGDVLLAGSIRNYGGNGAATGAGAGGSVWITCANFAATATAVINVNGGVPTQDASGGGAGGRASVCVGLTDEQIVALRASDDVPGVARRDLAEVVPGFTAAGGDCGGWNGSSGQDGTGVYLVNVGEGVSLDIAGDPVAAGVVTPPYGLSSQPEGEPFAIAAPASVDVHGAEGLSRYVCGGWIVTNAAGTTLASGAGNTGTLTLAEDAFLVWLWNVEHRMGVSAVGGGSVATNAIGSASSEWQPGGSRVSLTAVPEAGYVFIGWLGGAQGLDRQSATLEFNADQARDLTARFATAASGVKTWVGGTGNWMDDAGWDPSGVPGPATETRVPSGNVTLDCGFPAPVGSLLVSGGAKVLVGTDGSNTAASPPIGDDSVTDTVGLRVAGDLDLRGYLYLGGINQLRTSLLAVGGNLVLTNGASSYLYAFAGCRDDWGDPAMYRAGGGTVSVAGKMRVGNGATVYPVCASLSGAPVIFRLGSLLLEAGGRIYADYGGYWVYTANGELVGYAPGSSRTRAEFLATPYRGGSYGGAGGGSSAQPTYCTDFAPYQPGSPGDNYEKARAGGAIRIDCAGRAEVYGSVTANGADAGAKTRGGRSGGAIWITARRFITSSTATLSAKGGNQGNDKNSMAGGGGRICLAQGFSPAQISAFYEATELPRKAEKTDLLTGSVPEWEGTINVAGGSLSTQTANNGKAGTAVFVRAPIEPTLLLLR